MELPSSPPVPPGWRAEHLLRHHRMLNDWQESLNSLKKRTRALWDHIAGVRNGRNIIWLVGDSVFRGYALGLFSMPADDPLKPFNHVDLLMNQTVQEEADLAAYYPGVILLSQFFELCDEMVRDGDWVVFQDGGVHSRSYESHRAYVRMVKSLCLDRRDVRLILMTMPSREPAPENCRHDLPLADGKSINGAVADAARDAHRHNERVTLVHLAGVFAELGPWTDKKLGTDLFRSDGVHPDIWGNLVIALALLQAIQRPPPKLDRLKSLFIENLEGIRSAIGTPFLTAGLVAEMFAQVLRVCGDHRQHPR